MFSGIILGIRRFRMSRHDIAIAPFCSPLGSSADALSRHSTDATNLEQVTVMKLLKNEAGVARAGGRAECQQH
jgi:hypothetical protein